MTASAHDIILRACRNNAFKSRAHWGMRTNCVLGGFGTTERTPCVVLDLERTTPHPKEYGFRLPIVLASGDTWEDVLSTLVANGELTLCLL